jgi:phosphoribosyl-ATP pyrophosphohydrolase
VSDFLDTLTALIADRRANPKAGSYTNQLLADKAKAAQKVGEEATEVVSGCPGPIDGAVTEEMADLIYHSCAAGVRVVWAEVLAVWNSATVKLMVTF